VILSSEKMEPANIVLENKTPSAAEHHFLRSQAGGLTPPPQPENEEALKRSYFCVTLRDTSKDNLAVGMGRVVGDGMFLYIVDMAVLPAYQRKGLGDRILRRILSYVDEHAPRARLALEGDPPGVALYKRHGFKMQTYSKPMMRSTYWPSGPSDEGQEQIQSSLHDI
jgi:ribosomal protein S18 acetylase RimI-like enzyme